jgi:hypothetical protein
MAEIEDRYNNALMQLADVDMGQVAEWRGRAKAHRELLHYINSCLKINEN